MYYHDFIGKMLNKKTIACCGTHGKTTTTYFLTRMLDKKCNYIIVLGYILIFLEPYNLQHSYISCVYPNKVRANNN